MRVMCIDTTPKPTTSSLDELGKLREGCVYTVFGVRISHLGNHIYDLEEIRCGGDRGFLAIRFIPLSDIDKTELIKEREEAFA